MDSEPRTVIPRRKRVTDERMLDAACAEFADAGFERANVGRIATAAGTTKATVYARFASKSGLLAAALDRERGELRARLLSAYAADAHLRLRERLHRYVLAYFTYAAERPDGLRLLFLRDAQDTATTDVAAEISERIAVLVAAQLGESEPSDTHRLIAALVVGATHHGAGAMTAQGLSVATAAPVTEAFLVSALRGMGRLDAPG